MIFRYLGNVIGMYDCTYPINIDYFTFTQLLIILASQNVKSIIVFIVFPKIRFNAVSEGL